MNVYYLMNIDGNILYVKSFNALFMNLGGEGIQNKSIRDELSRASTTAFTKVCEQGAYASDGKGAVEMLLHIFYSPECDMWSLGRNIIFSMVNSTRIDDLFFNGHRVISDAIKKCHENKIYAFPATMFITKYQWFLYIGNKPACQGNSNTIPKLDPENETDTDILKKEEDVPFYLLKNSERAYQCSDIIIKVNNQDERKDARHQFELLIEDSRFELPIPKDRTTVGVLTTYTDTFEKSKPDDKSVYEYAVDFVVYLLNYSEVGTFNRDTLETIIHNDMNKNPDVSERYVYLDIINETTMTVTYGRDIIACMTAPEDWYDILLDMTADEDDEDDDSEINPYL